ncbi:hypothetical protein SI65_09181 [Aspergillus cristatus]|uniref:DUF676 domain-containing protein n=1 Tax=Aspergillus cristatus TaxID=573508 RepID=A0A1E3B2Q8_ASPCR|nr:hypothetical protein SI65_09181 [Aspergillus cristatus]
MNGSSSRATFPSGIESLYEPPDTTVDIVFVHGTTAGRDTTWTNQDASEPWPKTLLPSKFPTARILAFGYDAYVDDKQKAVLQGIIHDHSWKLLEELSLFRQNDRTDEKPIIFVCHGLGGLICKQALYTSFSNTKQQCLYSVFCSTRGIAFIDTPLHGDNVASLAEITTQSIGLDKQEDSDIVNNFKCGFKYVLAQNINDFKTMHEVRTARQLPPIKVVCFYAELPVEGFGFVVTRDSATLRGCTSIGIRKDHMDMTKFATMDDSGFIAVCESLGRWINEVDAKGPSADYELLNPARQQYNHFGKGEQKIFGGSCYETNGHQTF